MIEEAQAARDIAAAIISELGLTVDSEFIPFSQSRNKDETRPCLNWLVTLKRDGEEILSTPYSAGSAHCPAYSDPTLGRQDSVDRFKAIREQCETGRNGKPGRPGAWIKPDALDVIYSLSMDSGVLDYGDFESWAGEYGYDPDSRKAESIYRQCLDLALKFNASLGAVNTERLRSAFQDY
jgi:hypothetical protein